jgi:hypothetical protein
MHGVPKPKVKDSELVNAIHVLNQLKRRIDSEAEDAITHHGKWFLHSERAALITNDAIQRMEAVELVTRNLIQWYAVAEATKTTSRVKVQSGQGRSK